MNGLELLPLILLGFLLFYLIFPIWSYMRLSQMLREEREENRRVQTLILKRLRSLQAKMEQKTGSSESLADAEPEARTTVSSASYAEKKGRAGIHHSTEEFASLSFPDEESCGTEPIGETPGKLSVESSSVKSSSVETPSGESSAESPVETIISPATEHSKKTEFPENGAPAGKETIDSRTSEAWNRIVEWFCVGENYRYKNISREYAFATTWLIRIAVVILIAGVVFFLKFAVQNNLISPEVRIGCAFLAGCAMAIAGMIGAKRKYHIAAVGIMGAGFVTMYLSARAGYIVYSMTDFHLPVHHYLRPSDSGEFPEMERGESVRFSAFCLSDGADADHWDSPACDYGRKLSDSALDSRFELCLLCCGSALPSVARDAAGRGDGHRNYGTDPESSALYDQRTCRIRIGSSQAGL